MIFVEIMYLMLAFMPCLKRIICDPTLITDIHILDSDILYSHEKDMI